jgi:hypothetical protein
MGFDPQRPQKKRPSDYLFVVAAILAAAVLIGWALFG